MYVLTLKLVDFRSYSQVEVTFAPNLTAVVGPNGEGKTNLLEAIGYVGGLGSLRGAADSALIRRGCDVAGIRCEVRNDDGRDVLIEAEIAQGRPNRFKINRQRVDRRREALEALPLTIFLPADLELVQGEPGVRRRWLDDALAMIRPSSAALRYDLERILRQRNTLLRQAAGRAVSADVHTTLDVWDQKLSTVGEELRRRRTDLLEMMRPTLINKYEQMAGDGTSARAMYISSWTEGSLSESLAAARSEDLRRGVTTVGPHRDDVGLWIGDLPARSHASQGEHRSLALAMRLAVDEMVRRQCDVQPVVLLDDVFSELDVARAAALVESLPPGQKILTTATEMPHGIDPECCISLEAGVLSHAWQR